MLREEMAAMIRLFIAVTMIALITPALAAKPETKMPPARAKPCPKGQLALTSTITGDHYCATPGVSMVGGGSQPTLIAPTPAKKAKP